MDSFLVSQGFSDKVAFSGPWDCWEWMGSRNQDGYGHLGLYGRYPRAHCLVFEWFHERPVPETMEVMHLCDNPAGVNPCHLMEGSHADNMRDMAAKGRAYDIRQYPEYLAKHSECVLRGDEHWTRQQPEKVARGEAVGNSLLTEEDVREIRRLRAEGVAPAVLSARFGVSYVNIYAIVKGKTWKHVR